MTKPPPKTPPSGVTDVTAIPLSPPITIAGESGNTVTSVTPTMTDLVISDCNDLEQYLAPVSWEAAWEGRTEDEVTASRREWVCMGVTNEAFRKRWRQLNEISVAAFARLTGLKLSNAKKVLDAGSPLVAFEPFTNRAVISLSKVAQTFSINEIKRAMKGEDMELARFIAEFDGLPR